MKDCEDQKKINSASIESKKFEKKFIKLKYKRPLRKQNQETKRTKKLAKGS